MNTHANNVKEDGLVYENDELRLNIPRRLSNNETKMVDNAFDTVKGLYPDNSPLQKFVMRYAVRAILCSEDFWSGLSRPFMQEFRSARNRNERNKAFLKVEGLVIGMVHVYEVRHNVHRGTDIAVYIDFATRPLGYDALPGIIDKDFAYRIIKRAYSK